MGISLGDQPCLLPDPILASCLRQKLDTSWYGLPNSWTCTEGTESGRGFVLLSLGSLAQLDQDTLLDLEIAVQPVRVVHKSLLIVEATCLTPGAVGDSSQVYLVELADRRRLYRAIPCDVAFNLRSPLDPQQYLPESLNPDAVGGPQPWTWGQAVQHLWEVVGATRLGDFPGLPSDLLPNGTPEDFDFYGGYALDALGTLLDRIGCTLKLDTQADAFSLVRLGTSDSETTDALSSQASLAVWDDDPVEPIRARIPAKVRVLFAKLPLPVDGSSPYHVVDQSDPNPGLDGSEAGTVAQLRDDLPALVDQSGNPTNLAALYARATERAADYFRRLRTPRVRRIYGMPLSDSALLPSSLTRHARHGDRGRGAITEVQQGAGALEGHPYPAPAALDLLTGTEAGRNAGRARLRWPSERLEADWPLRIREDEAGRHLSLVQRASGFWARITETQDSPVRYSFIQVQGNVQGLASCDTVTDGVTGTLNAWEVNNNSSVHVNTVVWMRPRPAYPPYLLFGSSGSGSSSDVPVLWDFEYCCGAIPCCGGDMPRTLYASYASTSGIGGCACGPIGGQTITLVWSPASLAWIGTGPFGTCGHNLGLAMSCDQSGTGFIMHFYWPDGCSQETRDADAYGEGGTPCTRPIVARSGTTMFADLLHAPCCGGDAVEPGQGVAIRVLVTE